MHTIKDANRPTLAESRARLAERDARPPDTRDLTARLLGDPAPRNNGCNETLVRSGPYLSEYVADRYYGGVQR